MGRDQGNRAGRILVLTTNVRRQNPLLQSGRRNHGFNRPGRAQQVASHPLGRTDQDVMVAKDLPNGLGFTSIVGGRRRPVGIDVINVFRGQPGFLHGQGHRPGGLGSGWIWRSDVVGIRGRPVADNFP